MADPLQIVDRILYTEEQVLARTAELGAEITRFYEPKVSAERELVMIGILKGSFMFLSDLAKRVDLPCRVEFMSISSYGDAHESSGQIQMRLDVRCDLEGKHVLIVEDIVDTGLTIDRLHDLLGARNPASVRVCTMLSKQCKRKTSTPVDFVGFEIGDEWVVGYGLDEAQLLRNVPYVGCLKKP
eukprot:gnl/Trimastix_PCT/1907.p1 GENE.gnl/Trimastix_PCT/1907~~gnl/Trimastix_PCT/1907.p1  ORF type:complete len:206 (-),score=46.52 gnl/Trimastix_PCT/1907:227-778(-)